MLVIDDDRALGRAIARSLGPSCDVVVTTRGAEALEFVRLGARFDVVFCDLHMPVMDGAAVHAALLRVEPAQAARVIFLTGDPDDRWLADSRHVTLAKPFDVETLRALVRDRARLVAAPVPREVEHG